jgi:hypothetical protein
MGANRRSCLTVVLCGLTLAACGSGGGSGGGRNGVAGQDASMGADSALDAEDSSPDGDDAAFGDGAPFGDDAPEGGPVDAVACPAIGKGGLSFGSSFCDQCMVDSCCDVVTACFTGGEGGVAAECTAFAACVAKCDADAGLDGALDSCLAACTAAHVDDSGQPDPAVTAFDAVRDCMSVQCASARCE